MDKPPHPLSIPNFRAYWAARFSNTIALSSMTIIIGWQVYGIARDVHHMDIRQATFLLGMIGVAQFIPLFLLTPIVGLAADTYDRRVIVRLTTALVAVTIATLGVLTWLHALGLFALFAAAAAIGVAQAFSGPAFSALAPNLVPREVLPTAIAVSSIAWQIGAIAGPSLGGVLYAISPVFAYAVATILLLAALVAMLLIGKVPQPKAQTDTDAISRIVEGFRYVRRNRLVLATITLDLFAVLLAGATALLPVFARDILHVGSQGLGLLAASMGIGATASGLVFSIRPLSTNVGVKMLAAVIVFGASITTFGLSHWLWLSVAALMLAGASDMVSVYIRNSLVQLYTPDEMRGRVGAVNQLTVAASNELGQAESGIAGALLGPVGAVVLGGIGAIAVTLLWSRLFPELRLAKSFDPPEILQTPPEHGVTQS
jgi:MFS family permease